MALEQREHWKRWGIWGSLPSKAEQEDYGPRKHAGQPGTRSHRESSQQELSMGKGVTLPAVSSLRVDLQAGEGQPDHSHLLSVCSICECP